MNDLLFDTPWWLPAAIAAAGIGLFVSGNNRQRPPMRNAGLGVVALALLVVAVSWLVKTDKERVVERTDALVAAVDRQDWPAFEALLDENTSFASYTGKAQLANGARDSAQKFGLRRARIRSRTVRDDQTLITVTIEALSEQDVPPYPLPSAWEFDWQQRGDQWLLYQIRALSIGGQPGEAVGGQLPAPR